MRDSGRPSTDAAAFVLVPESSELSSLLPRDFLLFAVFVYSAPNPTELTHSLYRTYAPWKHGSDEDMMPERMRQLHAEYPRDVNDERNNGSDRGRYVRLDEGTKNV